MLQIISHTAYIHADTQTQLATRKKKFATHLHVDRIRAFALSRNGIQIINGKIQQQRKKNRNEHTQSDDDRTKTYITTKHIYYISEINVSSSMKYLLSVALPLLAFVH